MKDHRCRQITSGSITASQILNAGVMQSVLVTQRMKQCCDCGGSYPEEVFFHSTGRNTRIPHCMACQQSRRDGKKRANPWLKKAWDTIRRHARTRGYKDNRIFCEKFGWDAAQIAHDMELAWGNGCRYCRMKYKDMDQGYGSVTLDVINPKEDPYYETNVSIACRTCNIEKARTPPNIWAQKLRCYAKWQRRQSTLNGRRYDGPLFEVLYTSSIKSDTCTLYS